MASGIFCKEPLARPAAVDLESAARFFGLRGPDEAGRALLAAQAPAVLAAAAPRLAAAEFAAGENPALFSGRDIAAHLAGCGGYVLLGVTLGPGADTAIRRAGVGNVAAGAAADALAGALAEQAAEAAEALLRSRFSARGLFLTGRYSPGYGDWPLSAQRLLAQLLELPKTIGVTVSDTFLMLPRKSITAVLGVADHPVSGHLAGCGTCALRGNCAFRKRGETCFHAGK